MVQWERVFCDVDDFCRQFLPLWERQLIEVGAKRWVRPSALTVSEGMTSVIAFPWARFWAFKHFYLDFLCRYHRAAERLTVCRVDARRSGAAVCLGAHPLRTGDRHCLHRLPPLGRLSSPAYPCPLGVRGNQHPLEQNDGRRVLRLQASLSHQ